MTKTELELLGLGAERPAHVSYSQLDTYQSCSEKFKLRYIFKVPPSDISGALIGGRVVHEAIEWAEERGLWQDAGMNPDTLRDFNEEILLERFHELLLGTVLVAEIEGKPIVWSGKGNGEDFLWWSHQGEFMLRRYRRIRQKWITEGIDAVEGVSTEIAVEAMIGGTLVKGYVDKMLMHDGGEPIVVDWKTGKIGNASPFQFATYAALLRRARGITVTRGLAVFLRAADDGRMVQDMFFEELVDRMDQMYGTLVRGLEAEIFTPNPSWMCKGCDVRRECWYWKSQPEKEET